MNLRLIGGKYILDHIEPESCAKVWGVKALMDSKSTNESALLCSLDLGKPFKCEKVVADEFQLYIFGREMVEPVINYF